MSEEYTTPTDEDEVIMPDEPVEESPAPEDDRTELEKAVGYALRLSDSAAKSKLMRAEIRRNIATARAELIRSGVSKVVVESGRSELVDDAIITFCLVRMGREADRDRNEESFRYQQDNLRKSNPPVEEEVEDEE